MWRSLIVIGGLVMAVFLAQADGNSQRVVNAALVQVQDCLELNQAGSSARVLPGSNDTGEGLTLRSLFVTLGIGLLSILFFVPAALITEYVTRRGDDSYTGAAG